MGSISDNDCRLLGRLLGYPRAGGRLNVSRGTWTRLHESYGVERLRVSLQQDRPIAAAYFQFAMDEDGKGYTYTPLMKWAVLDFDAATPAHDLIMRETIRQIWAYWVKRGIHPCLTHSGSKGWHLWIFLDRDIEPGFFRGLYRDTLEAVGSTNESGKWHHESFMDLDSGKWVSEIDPLVKGEKGKGGIVKLPFSRHQKHKHRFELPVSLTALDTYHPADNPSQEVWAEATHVLREEWKVTQADLIEVFSNLKELGMRRPSHHKKSQSSTRLPLFEVPTIGTRQDEMDAIVASLPCLQNAARKSKSKEVRYDLRTPLVQVFAAYGYTREEIAVWIRDNINDEEDNLNPDMMIEQVNYWYPKVHLAKCISYNTPSNSSFCCPSYCGRDSPLEPKATKQAIIDIPPVTGKGVEDALDFCYKKRKHIQLFKSTRIGATTETVLYALRNNLKLIVVEPTMKITETIQTAIDLYAKEKNAKPKLAVSFLDTRKGCFIRANQVEGQRLTWDNEQPALEKLDYLSKPSCGQCKYNPLHNPVAEYVEIKPLELLCEGDVMGSQCQFITAINHMQKWDIVVITAAKLRAMEMSQWDNEWGNTTWVDNFKTWASDVDLVFLDEVSIYTAEPDLKLLIKRIPLDSDGGEEEYDLDFVLNDQAYQLLTWREDSTSLDLAVIVDDLKNELRDLRDTEGVIKYTRDIDIDDLDAIKQKVREVQKRIETYALHTNIALNTIFRAVSIAPELEWLIVNEPDGDAKRCLAVYIAPKFADLFKTFLTGMTRARIIASDATMPLFCLGTALGIDFVRINVGDPKATSELQKIVPFQFSIPAPHMGAYMDQVSLFLQWGEEFFGEGTFKVAVPSKKIYRLLMEDKALRGMDVLWHRSSDSVGVSCDKRVMLGVGAPYEPGGVESWKKVAYPKLFQNIEESNMWAYEMYKTLFQCLSRVKDPKSKERSVYIAFGHTEKELTQMKLNVVECPDIISLTACHTQDEMVLIPLLAGWFWKEHGMELSHAEQRAVFDLWWEGSTKAVAKSRIIELEELLPPRVQEGLVCVKCGHKWVARASNPSRQCPSCGSRSYI